MNLRALRIGPRLGLGFGSLLLLLSLIAGTGLWMLRSIQTDVVDLGTNWLPSIKALADIRSLSNGARNATLNVVLATEPAQRQAAEQRRRQLFDTELPEAHKHYKALISSPSEQAIYDRLSASWDRYRQTDDRLMALAAEGDARFTDARQLATGDAARMFGEAMAIVGELIAVNEEGSVSSVAKADAGYRQANLIITGLLLVALATGSGLAWAVTRSITQPVARAAEMVDTVARGDLTSHINDTADDEPGRLLQSLAVMNDNLRRLVSDVRSASDSIATGSSQIATGNADLSQRTEEQASNLEETAASMEEMTGVVRSTSDTAQEATRLASTAAQAAERGGEVVGEVVSTMQEISGASRKIAEIIGTIDGIAFQTNILALNAAVEAARAGEQGRGFAVVAGEVRTLAQRSAEAAREIKTLISSSVEKVETGSRLVDQAGSAMGDIVSQVQRVSGMITEIANASQEQNAGISQVGDAVNQLDQVTQQNAALVEQSAAAAESLKQQAARLAELVGTFRIGQDGGSHRATAAPVSPRTAHLSGTPAPRPAAAPAPRAASPAPRSAPAAAPSPASAEADWETF
ncbi:methyl-accepting chemotaxis protein [Pseudaquabacterium rugosum]|uniref:Methyl-accepting chemotaxis protein n=1 Tax=Pseudaquabacterium rugosum TaxID=2984194 RepID=A0ABU9B553_9BURK